MTLALALLVLIVLLHAADVATTIDGLSKGLEEANPLARFLFGRLGTIPAAICLKIALTLPMVLLCVIYPSWWPVPAIYAGSLTFIVWRNVRLISSAGGSL